LFEPTSKEVSFLIQGFDAASFGGQRDNVDMVDSVCRFDKRSGGVGLAAASSPKTIPDVANALGVFLAAAQGFCALECVVMIFKDNWLFFEPIFKNKAPLQEKFSKLGELRNAIRHSREVSEVTSLEGRASMVWFNEILKY
jgi:hypothetical protein